MNIVFILEEVLEEDLEHKFIPQELIEVGMRILGSKTIITRQDDSPVETL